MVEIKPEPVIQNLMSMSLKVLAPDRLFCFSIYQQGYRREYRKNSAVVFTKRYLKVKRGYTDLWRAFFRIGGMRKASCEECTGWRRGRGGWNAPEPPRPPRPATRPAPRTPRNPDATFKPHRRVCGLVCTFFLHSLPFIKHFICSIYDSSLAGSLKLIPTDGRLALARFILAEDYRLPSIFMGRVSICYLLKFMFLFILCYLTWLIKVLKNKSYWKI